MPESILEPYRAWLEASNGFCEVSDEFLEHMRVQGLNAEDLGDWVESIRTLISFSPHVPKAEDIPR
jgi:hypothetical protein